jgi:hypothetical protein
LLLLLASQNTGASNPSCLSNVHPRTLPIPCYLIQSLRYQYHLFK